MALAETKYGKFFYFQPDDIGRRIAAGEFFDVHLKPYMDQLVEGDTLIDVGANIGFFTIYAALVRRSKVVAFEASEKVFNILRQNVEANGVQHLVLANRFAVYDRKRWLKRNPNWTACPVLSDGTLDYENCPNSGGLSLVADDDSIEGIYPAIAIDDLPWTEPVKLLKVDTQGADFRVLAGARRTIERWRPIICFEFEHDGSGKNASGDSLEDFLLFFDGLNYRVKKIADMMCSQDYVAEPA
jgi:FkbM family methyltransferase